jgi:ribosomal protein S27AE
MKVVSLKCVNCGASLEIGPHVDNFACGYCGTQQRVDRGGGIVSLRKIETTLSEVRQATDRTASELALVRLQGDLSSLPTGRRSEGTSSC